MSWCPFSVVPTYVWRCIESFFRFWIFLRKYEYRKEVKVSLSSADWGASCINFPRFAKSQLHALAQCQFPVNTSVTFVSPSVGADCTHSCAHLGNKAVIRYQVLQRDEYNEEIELQRCFDCTVLFGDPFWRKWSEACDRLMEIFKNVWIFRGFPFNCLQCSWMFISVLLVFVCVTGPDLWLCVLHHHHHHHHHYQ